jgi:hypothetical protein
MGTNKEVSFITSSVSPSTALWASVDDEMSDDRLSKKKRQDQIDTNRQGADRIGPIGFRLVPTFIGRLNS